MSAAPRPVRLLLDENLSPWVARQLREDGVDAVHVNERKLTGATDAEVLERSYEEDRVLVTSNVEDFELLCRAREVHAGEVGRACPRTQERRQARRAPPGPDGRDRALAPNAPRQR